MPIEITEAEDREYRRYKELGTPSDLAEKVKKVGELETDNKALRDERRELRGKVPKDGSVILEGEDAKRWDAFKAIGKTPEELAAGLVLTPDERKEWEALKKALEGTDLKPENIPAVLEENRTLKEQGAKRAWEDGVAALAKAEGIPEDSVPALSAILRTLDPKAAIEVKTEKVKDQAGAETDKPTAYVTLTGKQAAKFADLRGEVPELKGIRTTNEEEKKESENRWTPTPTGAQPKVRTQDDHRKAVTAQLDYQV